LRKNIFFQIREYAKKNIKTRDYFNFCRLRFYFFFGTNKSIKFLIKVRGEPAMKQMIVTLIALMLLAGVSFAANPGSDVPTEENIFNQQVKLNSCENFNPEAPLVAEVIKEVQETVQKALDEGMAPDTILQMARNAKCSVQILPLVEQYLQDVQPYTPEQIRGNEIPHEKWENNDASPSTP
jgi:hypothetical protein